MINNDDTIKKQREEILKERQNFEQEKQSWNKLFLEQKSRLEKEIEILQKFQKIQQAKNLKIREEQKLEEIKNDYDSKEIKAEIENIKSLYNNKLNQLENQKKILEEEKENFEKLKKDKNNSLQMSRMDIEQKKLELLKQNSEINKRYNDLRNKEYYLKEKYEDYRRIKDFVEMKENQNNKVERDLILASERIQQNIKEIEIRENQFEKERTDLLKKIYESNEQKKKLENDKLDLQQEEAEINLRYQNLSNFTYKSPNVNNVEKYNMTMPLLNENNNLENTDKNFNSYSYSGNRNNYIDNTLRYGDKMENGSNYNNKNYEKFSAEKYLNSLKDRIENGKRINYPNLEVFDDKNKFDIAKEREYIRKSKEILEKKVQNI